MEIGVAACAVADGWRGLDVVTLVGVWAADELDTSAPAVSVHTRSAASCACSSGERIAGTCVLSVRGLLGGRWDLPALSSAGSVPAVVGVITEGHPPHC